MFEPSSGPSAVDSTSKCRAEQHKYTQRWIQQRYPCWSVLERCPDPVCAAFINNGRKVCHVSVKTQIWNPNYCTIQRRHNRKEDTIQDNTICHCRKAACWWLLKQQSKKLPLNTSESFCLHTSNFTHVISICWFSLSFCLFLCAFSLFSFPVVEFSFTSKKRQETVKGQFQVLVHLWFSSQNVFGIKGKKIKKSEGINV